MSKVLVTDDPTTTLPKSMSVGAMLSCGAPETPVPDIGTVTEPVVDVKASCEVLSPVDVGAKLTGTVTESPAATVKPGAWSELAENAPVGFVTAVTVVLVVPVLVISTLDVTTPPVGTSPKAMDDGMAIRPSLVPRPWRSKASVPAFVENDSAPERETGVVGVKVTGTVMA